MTRPRYQPTELANAAASIIEDGRVDVWGQAAKNRILSKLGAEVRGVLDDASLTDRQLEFLLLRAAGCSIRTIARSYRISPATVRDHLEAADRKLEAAKGAPK